MRTARPGKSKKLDQAHGSCQDHGWVPSAGLSSQTLGIKPSLQSLAHLSLLSYLDPPSLQQKPGGKEFKEVPEVLRSRA